MATGDLDGDLDLDLAVALSQTHLDRLERHRELHDQRVLSAESLVDAETSWTEALEGVADLDEFLGDPLGVVGDQEDELKKGPHKEHGDLGGFADAEPDDEQRQECDFGDRKVRLLQW